jgi:hypothetical protein
MVFTDEESKLAVSRVSATRLTDPPGNWMSSDGGMNALAAIGSWGVLDGGSNRSFKTIPEYKVVIR